MYPVIELCGCQIPVYLLFALTGFSAAVLLTNHMLLERLILRKYIGVFLISCIGLWIGARAFGICSRLLGIYATEHVWKMEESLSESGLVYLGGLIGYILSLRFLCRFKGRSWAEISNIAAVVIPLFHFFGRIGCYFAGCCYGAASESWFAVPYRIVLKDGEWMNRIPIQLIEAGAELCLFVIFLYRYQRKKKTNALSDHTLLRWYMIIYASARFILEFWRGDTARGMFGWISFSQVICVLILIRYIILKSLKGYCKNE